MPRNQSLAAASFQVDSIRDHRSGKSKLGEYTEAYVKGRDLNPAWRRGYPGGLYFAG